MRADDRALADLAGSVADGQPVDWQATEARADVRDRRLIRHLRLVESIASLYRSIPPDDAADVPSAAPPAEPTGPRWGRLVMLERIGHGTSGDVFRAWDSELHREVALKLLHDDGGRTPAADGTSKEGGPAAGGESRSDTHARMLQEARRLARVRHPHVVQVYGAEQHDGRVGLWMELVRGESLEQILAARGSFGAREAALIGQDLCAALAAVHGAGLLHRDVKAQNVLRESGGRTVLMDFGTGEELRQEAATTRMAGTPLYLAPEIFKGQAASVQSDLYSLGVLLFYLVSGQFPVTAGSIEQLARAHAHQQKRRLRDLRPDLPASFVHVVERALEPDPGQRYRTAGEMEAALKASADAFQQPAVAPEVGWFSFSRRPRLALAAAVLAMAVVAVGLIVWSRNSDQISAPTPIRRIAVLPMSDLSGSSTPAYLVEGLTDQLISALGQIEAFHITPRSSVMRFKDRAVPLSQMASELKVDGFVESTLLIARGERDGPERVRVNARLIAAGPGTLIWSDTFERNMGDTFALQSDIARSIARAVRAAITPAESARLSHQQQTSAAVERAYYEGRYYLATADRVQLAFEAFRRALELDPNYAPAHAGLAASYLDLANSPGTISNAEARAKALGAAGRAAALDPDLSEAQTTLADLKFAYDWDWRGADEAYRRALDLNASSTYTRTQYARYLAAARRLDEAVVQADRAAEFDPQSVDAAQIRGLILYFKRDYPGALQTLEQALHLDAGRPGTHILLARVHSARGAFEQAIGENESAIGQATQPVPGWNAHLIMLYALAGRPQEARTGLAQLEADAARSNRRLRPAHLAYIYVALGDRARAFDLLERAVDERDPDVVFLAVDPRVDSLRADPRFSQLLAKLGTP